jgi:hypothetical protein
MVVLEISKEAQIDIFPQRSSLLFSTINVLPNREPQFRYNQWLRRYELILLNTGIITK